MTDFRPRVCAAAKQGALTTADLALWFDSAYPTMKAWRWGIHAPNAARGAQLDGRLTALEQAVKEKQFPLALSVRAAERKTVILAIRHRYAQL